jgi:hypothetical protein
METEMETGMETETETGTGMGMGSATETGMETEMGTEMGMETEMEMAMGMEMAMATGTVVWTARTCPIPSSMRFLAPWRRPVSPSTAKATCSGAISWPCSKVDPMAPRTSSFPGSVAEGE